MYIKKYTATELYQETCVEVSAFGVHSCHKDRKYHLGDITAVTQPNYTIVDWFQCKEICLKLT